MTRRVLAGCFALSLCATPLLAQRGGGAAPPPRDPMMEGLQLRPSRTVTWTSDIGHWMSSDVSPDGNTLVFDILGDIYTMPISGGKATPLTRGMAFDGQPRFSPDGRKVAFVSDRDGGWNLWTISLDKKDTAQITRGKTNTYQSPEWTPDGKYIIAERGTKLWVFHVDGGSGQQLIRSTVPAGQQDVIRQMGAAFGPDPPVHLVRAAAGLMDLQHADERLRPRRLRPGNG